MRVGPYEMERELGRGAMGVVYRATHTTLGRVVALKILDPSRGATAEMLARFRREAQSAARLAGHPNIVAVHDVGEAVVASDATTALADARQAAPTPRDQGAAQDARPVLYLAMDLIEGRSLADVIEEGELSPMQVAELMETVARAVHFAHEQGVIHRDLKPANVLIGFRRADGDSRAPTSAGPRLARADVSRPAAYVVDFGVAAQHTADAHLTRLTQAGTVLGTPAYMPPEQARGQSVDARADVYALGVTCYEALAGQPPFGGDTTYAVLAAVLRHEFPPLRRLAPHVPSAFAEVVARAMAASAAERYPTALALAEDLGRVRRGEPVLAPGSGVVPRILRTARRRPATAAGAAIVAVAGIAGGVLSWRAADRDAEGSAALASAGDATRTQDRISQIAGAWYDLVRATLPDMRALEDHWHGAVVPDGTRQAARRRIGAEVARVAAAYPATALPAAWEALARDWAGDSAALADLRAATARQPDDPLPHVCLALALLARYADATRTPHIAVARSRLRIEAWLEPPEQREWREAAAAALAAACGSPLRGALAHGAEALTFADGAARLARADHAGAVAALAGLADDPLLGPAAGNLLGLARFLAGDASGATAAWAAPEARGWTRARTLGTLARVAIVIARTRTGDDPRPGLREVLRLIGEGVVGARDPVELLLFRGNVHSLLARESAERGEDPRPHHRGSLDDYAEVLRRAPGHLLAPLNRAIALTDLAHADAMAGAPDPWPAFAQAVAAFDVALRVLPDDLSALIHRAQALATWGDDEAARGLDPAARYAASLAELDRALAIAPGDAGVLRSRGDVHFSLGQRAGDTGGDPRPDLRRAIADFTGALAADPEDGRSVTHRGLAWLLIAQVENRAGEDARPASRSAVTDLARSLELLPGLAPSLNGRGAALQLLAKLARQAGEDPVPHLEAAMADMEAAARANPKLWEAHANRGLILVDLGRPAEAVAEFEAALAIVPGHPLLSRQLADARAAAGR